MRSRRNIFSPKSRLLTSTGAEKASQKDDSLSSAPCRVVSSGLVTDAVSRLLILVLLFGDGRLRDFELVLSRLTDVFL